MITNSTKKIRELSFVNSKRNMTSRAIKHVMLFAFMIASFQILAQERHKVTGKITAASDNSAVPGTNVIIKGTTNGTATDVDGNYAIEASENDVLVFSYIGYESQEITVGGKTVINVSMVEDISKLSEVVVVGYGQMKKSTITGAQTSVKSADIEKTVNTTVEQAIQGRAAGVYITQNSGQPGGGISVNIRGINSINGSNEPLYVIDGVQIAPDVVSFGSTSSANPLSGLNPSDIESIEVLQGPSATAIYGSRATNGVLLITTKRGKAGETKISYGYQYSQQTEPKPLETMNLRQYAQMVNEYHDIAGGDDREEFLDPTLLGDGTNWQDALFTNAPMNKHQLSLSGGQEKLTYYLSGEYLKQAGVALGSGFDRYSVRLNVDNKVRKWLNLGANLNFNQTKQNLTTSQENIITDAIRMSPQVPVRNMDGSYGGDRPENGANQYSPVNPIAIAELITNDLTRREFLGGVNAGVDLLPGLTFRTSFNTNISYRDGTYFIPKYKFGTYNENAIARLTETNETNTYWNWNQLLEYNKQFGDHYVSLMGSHESQASTWRRVQGSRSGFLTNDLIDLELGDLKTSTTGGGSSEWAMESYFGRLNYNFKEKYILMGTVRADGSANFGPDNRWGIFPAISAAWRVSKENFFNIDAINELKLRFETGTTGNNGWGGIYSRLATRASGWGSGFLAENYGNPGLKWEETKTNNAGLNLALFQNRIQVEFDYYVKKTENLIMDQPYPNYMGTAGEGSISPPVVNIGSLTNRGWALTVNTVNIDRGGFKWETKFNISGFKTKIDEFYSDQAFVSRQSWWMDSWEQRAVVGEAPWLFRGYVYDGLFQSVEDLENSALPVDNSGNEFPIEDSDAGIWVGDVKYKDISGPEGKPDGKITVDDQTFIGNPWPKYFAGLTNDFSYKGFTLSALITTTQGNDIYNYVARVNTNPNNINLSRNLLIDAFDYAKVTTDADGNAVLANPGTNVPRFSTGKQNNFAVHSSRWVEDGSFIRIKNISLNYNVPSALLSKTKVIKGARVGVSAQNVATFTKYKGFDPEVGAYVGRDAGSDNQAIGIDNGRYPLTPVYSFNVGIDF